MPGKMCGENNVRGDTVETGFIAMMANLNPPQYPHIAFCEVSLYLKLQLL